MSCARTTEPIQKPFGRLTILGPGNHVLDAARDWPAGRGTFEGYISRAGQCTVIRNYGVCMSCATAMRPFTKLL